MSLADLFQPPIVRPRPTRVIRRADVEPPPRVVYTAPPTVKPHANPRKPKVTPGETKYSRLSPEAKAQRNQQSADWYAANRARALAQAKARYEAMTPEAKAAKLAYGRALKARKRAEKAASNA